MVVSIIVPIYNAEKYLDRCVESILSQTYTDIEVILVNDGSPDESESICRRYAALDKRVVLINQENKGLGGARNSGLKVAKGSYIGFIDADDAINPDMVSDFVDVAMKEEPDVICSNILVYEKGNLKYNEIRNELPYNQILKSDDIKKYFLQPYYGGYMGIISSACTKMYQKNFLIENDLFFNETIKRTQDYWFNFETFKKANTIYTIDHGYYHYYNNDDSMIRNYKPNGFEMYVSSRQKLINENKKLNLEVNWEFLNQRFFEEANEYILLCIKSLGYLNSFKVVKNIFKHKEFKKAYKVVLNHKRHTKIIKKLLPLNLFLMIHFLFCVWSLKIK
jgi:glycosyltransferase involved in cell wall biosynthesis